MTSTTATIVRIAAETAAEAKGYKVAPAEAVKDWGKTNGYKVNEGRGRMPLSLVEAFNKANKRRRVVYVPGTDTQPEQVYEFTTAAGRKSKFKAQPQDVRAWAKDKGLTVGERGRFSAAVRDAYGQAHAPVRKARKSKATASA